MTEKQKQKADSYVEIVFDDILERSENAALWVHADPFGDVTIYASRGDDTRRAIFVEGFAAAMTDDPELMDDVAFSLALAVSGRDINADGLTLPR